MKWFWKRKDPGGFGQKGALEDTVPVKSYAPNLDLVPRDYLIPQCLADFEADFDRRAAAFLQETNPDVYNGAYLDGLILAVRDEALDSLAFQRADHVGVITDLLEQLWKGDAIKCQAKLEAAQEELEAVEQELAKLIRIYHRGTALAEEGGEDHEAS